MCMKLARMLRVELNETEPYDPSVEAGVRTTLVQNAMLRRRERGWFIPACEYYRTKICGTRCRHGRKQ